MVGSRTQLLGGCRSNTVLSASSWSLLLALMGKSLPFWRQRLSFKKKGLMEMVQPPQCLVDLSFLLGSPISFLGSPAKEDFLIPSDISSTWIEGERGSPITPCRGSEGFIECDLKSFTSREVCSTPVNTYSSSVSCSSLSVRPRCWREGDNLLSPRISDSSSLAQISLMRSRPLAVCPLILDLGCLEVGIKPPTSVLFRLQSSFVLGGLDSYSSSDQY